MAIDPPDGYVTRPTAARLYNRAQRSLERDLEEAYATGNDDVLSVFKLITNDNAVRDAQQVSTELVEQFKRDGKNPAWCVDTSWLENEFGKKGSPRPRRTSGRSEVPWSKPFSHLADSQTPSEADTSTHSLPDDISFLKERILVLEQEKKEEIERNRQREERLFAQLAVKDEQIKNWDSISQGLTQALATGQLVPMLPMGGSKPPTTKVTDAATMEDKPTTNNDRTHVVGSAAVTSKQPATRSGGSTRQGSSRSTGKKKTTTTSRRTRSSKAASKGTKRKSGSRKSAKQVARKKEAEKEATTKQQKRSGLFSFLRR